MEINPYISNINIIVSKIENNRCLSLTDEQFNDLLDIIHEVNNTGSLTKLNGEKYVELMISIHDKELSINKTNRLFNTMFKRVNLSEKERHIRQIKQVLHVIKEPVAPKEKPKKTVSFSDNISSEKTIPSMSDRTIEFRLTIIRSNTSKEYNNVIKELLKVYEGSMKKQMKLFFMQEKNIFFNKLTTLFENCLTAINPQEQFHQGILDLKKEIEMTKSSDPIGASFKLKLIEYSYSLSNTLFPKK